MVLLFVRKRLAFASTTWWNGRVPRPTGGRFCLAEDPDPQGPWQQPSLLLAAGGWQNGLRLLFDPRCAAAALRGRCCGEWTLQGRSAADGGQRALRDGRAAAALGSCCPGGVCAGPIRRIRLRLAVRLTTQRLLSGCRFALAYGDWWCPSARDKVEATLCCAWIQRRGPGAVVLSYRVISTVADLLAAAALAADQALRQRLRPAR